MSTECNTANEFLIKKSPLEKWQSCRFKESLLLLGTDLSDRKTALLLNKLRDQDKGVIPTTVRNCVVRNGVAIAAETEAKADKALDDANFVPGIIATKERLELFNDKSFFLDNDIIAKSAKDIGILNYCQADYEDPSRTLCVSIDDIGVKCQNPARPMPDGTTKPKYVENTATHFQSAAGSYVFTGYGIPRVLRNVLGFMAFNGAPAKQSRSFLYRWGQTRSTVR